MGHSYAPSSGGPQRARCWGDGVELYILKVNSEKWNDKYRSKLLFALYQGIALAIRNRLSRIE
jgi:hypothetical protein